MRNFHGLDKIRMRGGVYRSPLDKGDHPELNTSELLDTKGVPQYQSLISSLQWSISLGRFDIAMAGDVSIQLRSELVHELCPITDHLSVHSNSVPPNCTGVLFKL